MDFVKYNLFLDDVRLPSDVTWITLPNVNWVIVRSYDEFVNYITNHSVPSLCSYDHDLGLSAYQEFHRAYNTDGIFHYDNVKEKTGYHACKWLIEYCLDNKVKFPDFIIHTMNPIGKQNIQSLIDSYRKSCKMDT